MEGVQLTQELEGQLWREAYEAHRDTLIEANAYNPADEKDSCGVGLVVNIDGTPKRAIVEMAIKALKNVWHRGAVDADGKTGRRRAASASTCRRTSSATPCAAWATPSATTFR